ncbi:MAG: lipoyl(octanoyl) transferase LipB [Trichloromonadaceae bacterium]
MSSPSQYLPPTDIPLILRHLGRQPYEPVWQRMQKFSASRGPDTPDEIWLLEHDPVFTLGREGKAEHLLEAGEIPLVRVDRGGQITYHGPGQLVVYLLLDLRRRRLGVRRLVEQLEQSLCALLAGYGIKGHLIPSAPGVYVNGAKIASLGLRVSQGRTSHGLALNINMDQQPFAQINPCGHQGLAVTQLKDLAGPSSIEEVGQTLLALLATHLGYQQVITAPA